jgi:hypothetical protein
MGWWFAGRIGRSRTAVVRGSRGMFALAGQCGRHQSRHADQVVRGSYEVPRELRSRQPDVARASEPTDCLHPTKDFLNGLFTNDKFCWSRPARLDLKWWHRAYRDR